MSDERDYQHDMPRFPLDDATADRLLAGRVAPDDAPPGYGHLASLIASATGPATPAELAQEAVLARAAAAAVVSAGVSAPSPNSRGRSVISKLVTAKFAAAATVAAFGVGTAAAAASGALPGQHPSHHAAVVAQDDIPTSTSSTTSTTLASGTTTTQDLAPLATGQTGPAITPSLPETGPANANAQFGLCTAFLAHHPSATATGPGNSDEAPPFQALMAQNGGMAGTYTYCQGVVTSRTTSTTSTTTGSATESPDNVTPVHPPVSTGRPADPGSPSHSGDGSGHPTGDSGSHVPAGGAGASASHGH